MGTRQQCNLISSRVALDTSGLLQVELFKRNTLFKERANSEHIRTALPFKQEIKDLVCGRKRAVSGKKYVDVCALQLPGVGARQRAHQLPQARRLDQLHLHRLPFQVRYLILRVLHVWKKKNPTDKKK